MPKTHELHNPSSHFFVAKLAVLYGSPRRHSNRSKTFLKNQKKCRYILELAELFKIMNRPGPSRPDRNAI